MALSVVLYVQKKGGGFEMRKLMMYMQVLLGNALIAIAFGVLIIPNEIASGGTTGMAMIVSKFVPLPLSVVVLMINAVLFAAGFLYLGKCFMVLMRY